MSDVKLISFQQAIDQHPESHLLLGNGFSRAFRDDIFSYDALLKQADFSALNSKVKEAFTALRTTDFEAVMRALRNASQLVNLYFPDLGHVSITFKDDIDALKSLLAKTIALNHPEGPFQVLDSQFESCRKFLSNFKDVYTLNYDLLLYWTLMHRDKSEFNLFCDDGFREPDDAGCDFVTWEVQNTNKQNIFYLHGALHLFDAGPYLKKFTWIKSGVKLLDQIGDALNADLFPLIVAEGNSEQKLDKINHSNYLSRAFRSFVAIGGTLFVFGHSMGEADEHILRLIELGNITTLFVGIYGDPNSPSNQVVTTRAIGLSQNRKQFGGRKPKLLSVNFFDSSQAAVWE